MDRPTKDRLIAFIAAAATILVLFGVVLILKKCA